jgi:16S rRNA (adenine1518-N6/adenine1519-N6)-dimethyltransferase
VAAGLGRRALRSLATRHGIHPTKALGQHFLADPNTARRIAGLAEVRPGDHVVEVGPGLGSLTVALAGAGAEILAVELDPAMLPALTEVTDGLPVTVVLADALRVDWPALLGSVRWKMVSNLPYNLAASVVLDMVEEDLAIDRYVVMVQREVGERLVAGPGEAAYGATSVRVAYRARPRLLRRVPPTVFWPEPTVESVLLELVPREPPVSIAPDRLFRVVEEGFAQRRKTMRNALIRLGLAPDRAASALDDCGLDARARAEELAIPHFACLAEAIGD